MRCPLTVTCLLLSTVAPSVWAAQGGPVDLLAPVVLVTSQAPSRVDGVARDDQPLDTGIASVALEASSVNLSLFVEPFAPGAPSVTWSLGRMDSLLPGTGTIVAVDVAGNSTQLAVDVAPSGDCNGNGVPDNMDLMAQTSYDWNGNGLPDECEQVGFVYCASPQHNSTGLPAHMIVTGSNRIQDNNLVATAYNAVPLSFGFFAVSQTSDFVSGQATGFSYGNICLGTPIGGFRNGLIQIDAQGQFSRIADLTSFPVGGGSMALMPGTTVFIQGWYRDRGTFIRNNLTDAVEILFH
jgi:hypothetical protein